jgi:hypothetical protein
LSFKYVNAAVGPVVDVDVEVATGPVGVAARVGLADAPPLGSSPANLTARIVNGRPMIATTVETTAARVPASHFRQPLRVGVSADDATGV